MIKKSKSIFNYRESMPRRVSQKKINYKEPGELDIALSTASEEFKADNKCTVKNSKPLDRKSLALQRLENGESVEQVAMSLNISPTTITSWVLNEEATFDEDSGAGFEDFSGDEAYEDFHPGDTESFEIKQQQLAKVTVADKLRAITRVDEGVPIETVAEEFNIRPATIMFWLENRESIINQSSNNNPDSIGVTKFFATLEEKVEALGRLDYGVSIEEIAREFRVKTKTVQIWLANREVLEKQYYMSLEVI